MRRPERWPTDSPAASRPQPTLQDSSVSSQRSSRDGRMFTAARNSATMSRSCFRLAIGDSVSPTLARMAKITGLTFILPVRDLDRAAKFYAAAFDLQEVFRNEGIVFMGAEGSDSSFGLLLDPENAGAGPAERRTARGPRDTARRRRPRRRGGGRHHRRARRTRAGRAVRAHQGSGRERDLDLNTVPAKGDLAVHGIRAHCYESRRAQAPELVAVCGPRVLVAACFSLSEPVSPSSTV